MPPQRVARTTCRRYNGFRVVLWDGSIEFGNCWFIAYETSLFRVKFSFFGRKGIALIVKQILLNILGLGFTKKIHMMVPTQDVLLIDI